MPPDQAPWRALLPRDPGYPVLLREVAGAPPLLIRGALEARAPVVAVVGARRSTPYGEELAYRIGAGLAAAGVVVASGLARGIDAAAHRGALAAGGRTVAVMGTGPDRVYPRQHAALAEAIVSSGALVTQFPAGVAPLPANFPIRNAVISGLSLGVVVVEARRRSGAMSTAGAAANQGRLVMALPGSVHAPGSGGCHQLIRDGAALVTGAEEVLELVGAEPLARLVAWPARSTVDDGGVAGDGGAAAGIARWGAGSPEDAALLELLEGRPATLEQVRLALRLPAAEAARRVSRLRDEGLIGLSGGLYRALHARLSAPLGGAPEGVG